MNPEFPSAALINAFDNAQVRKDPLGLLLLLLLLLYKYYLLL